MQFINPIEILGLSKVTEITSIDNEIVKKAKRKLFAEIDLSDNGLIDYYGIQITKGDCENAIDELNDSDFKEYYFYLTTNKELNAFLANGNDSLFSNFKHDSIYKLPEFIKFISPYFAHQFDKALFNAFIEKNLYKFKLILNTSFLISQSEINNAYKSISNNIKSKIEEVAKIRVEIKNEESIYDENDIDEVVNFVVDYFPKEILNSLPNYFHSQILKIAKEINYLNVVIWDVFENTQVCKDLLEHVLTLNIDGLDKPTFQKNYDIISRKHKEKIELEKNASILKKYAGYLIQSKIKIQAIQTKTTTPANLLNWVNSTISTFDLNQLPSVFDEIKNQVAFSLRAMSVEVWNTFSDIDVSLELINKASSIEGLKPETMQNLQVAKKQLSEFQNNSSLKRRPPINSQTKQSSNVPQDNDSIFFRNFSVIIIIGIIIGVIYFAKYLEDLNAPKESHIEKAINNSNSYSSNNSTPESPNTQNPSSTSKYKGNQLWDGASPLTGCFGREIFKGRATLTIKNGGNSDAIICLYSVDLDRTIRNEYVQKESSYKMSKIAEGNYKIRVFYGNDWNPEMKNSCGTNGFFESDVNFTEFDRTEYFEDSKRGYTNLTITLYTVPGGNASSSSIDQTQFFKK